MISLVGDECLSNLVQVGFSEYEARAYVVLLGESPVTGYRLSRLSGIPSSMIYEVLAKLTARGAVMTSRRQRGTLYTPVPAGEFLGRLRREHHEIVASLKEALGALTPTSRDGHTWNVEGHERILDKAAEMIARAETRVHLALAPSTFPSLQPAAKEAIERGVNVVVYATDSLDLPGGRVVITPVLREADARLKGHWLILSIDGKEALAGAQPAVWTSSPLFVFVIEHYLRADLCVSRILALEDADGVAIW